MPNENANRLTTYPWEKVCSFIMTESLTASIQLRSMGKACISGRMAANTMESGAKTRYKALEPIPGQMEDSTKESGQVIAWMV